MTAKRNLMPHEERPLSWWDRQQEAALAAARVKRRGGSSAMEAIAIENAMKNHTRRTKRDKAKSKREVELVDHDPESRAWHEPDHAFEVLDEVRSLWGRLTQVERIAFQLVVLSDMTYSDAAEHLGVKPNAIKSALRRGRQRLRDNPVTGNPQQAKAPKGGGPVSSVQ